MNSGNNSSKRTRDGVEDSGGQHEESTSRKKHSSFHEKFIQDNLLEHIMRSDNYPPLPKKISDKLKNDVFSRGEEIKSTMEIEKLRSFKKKDKVLEPELIADLFEHGDQTDATDARRHLLLYLIKRTMTRSVETGQWETICIDSIQCAKVLENKSVKSLLDELMDSELKVLKSFIRNVIFILDTFGLPIRRNDGHIIEIATRLQRDGNLEYRYQTGGGQGFPVKIRKLIIDVITGKTRIPRQKTSPSSSPLHSSSSSSSSSSSVSSTPSHPENIPNESADNVIRTVPNEVIESIEGNNGGLDGFKFNLGLFDFDSTT